MNHQSPGFKTFLECALATGLVTPMQYSNIWNAERSADDKLRICTAFADLAGTQNKIVFPRENASSEEISAAIRAIEAPVSTRDLSEYLQRLSASMDRPASFAAETSARAHMSTPPEPNSGSEPASPHSPALLLPELQQIGSTLRQLVDSWSPLLQLLAAAAASGTECGPPAEFRHGQDSKVPSSVSLSVEGCQAPAADSGAEGGPLRGDDMVYAVLRYESKSSEWGCGFRQAANVLEEAGYPYQAKMLFDWLKEHR